MNAVPLQTILIHQEGYCSHRKAPSPALPRTLQEGIAIIAGILRKDVLCCHDVKLLNRMFREVDALEQRADSIPDDQSVDYALRLVVEKIEAIRTAVMNKDGSSHWGLISLYHLQKFEEGMIGILPCFNQLSGKFEKSEANINRLAASLPCCESKDEFAHDIAALIGASPSEEAKELLEQKKKHLKDYEQRIAQVKEKKEALKKAITADFEQRKKDLIAGGKRSQQVNNDDDDDFEIEPVEADFQGQLGDLAERDLDKYPLFLEELLDNGYIALYDHFLEMRLLQDPVKSLEVIKKMSVSQFSHVILQGREAIIRKVQSSFPEAMDNVVFFLGGTGAGKTTALCALGGDEMLLRDDGTYALKKDPGGLIGHEGSTSCTFLPNIKVINGLIAVDWAGFEDTNGPLIGLAIEFALRCLIKAYQPKIVVFESITNTDTKYNALRNLRKRLADLLDNPENCLLGLTKYSNDRDVLKIKGAEEQEQELVDRVESLNEPASQAKRATWVAKLADLKGACKARLKVKENKILKISQLGRIVRFQNLENRAAVAACLKGLSELSSKDCIRIRAKPLLNAGDEKLLRDLFLTNLPKEVNVPKQHADPTSAAKAFEAFERSVLETSLIQTMHAGSHPEIGRLVHLPEMDPQFVRERDREVCEGYFNKYRAAVVQTLDLGVMNTLLSECADPMFRASATPGSVKGFEKSLCKLVTYIEGLEGVRDPFHESSTSNNKSQEKWKELRKAVERISASKEEHSFFPLLSMTASQAPFSSIVWMTQQLSNLRERGDHREPIDNFLDKCRTDVEQMLEILLRLNELKEIIAKKEKLEEAYHSVKISDRSFADLTITLIDRINKVRDVYGKENWDRQVAFLAERLSLTGFNNNNERHIDTLIAFAYSCIEPGLFVVAVTPKEANSHYWGLAVVPLNNDHVKCAQDLKRELSAQTWQIRLARMVFGGNPGTYGITKGIMRIAGDGILLEMPSAINDFIGQGYAVKRVLAADALFAAHGISKSTLLSAALFERNSPNTDV